MDKRLRADESLGPPEVSTGHLPPIDQVRALVGEAHQRYATDDDGKVADYIPALACVPRGLFGICGAALVERWRS